MSAFLVTDETMHRAVKALKPAEQGCDWGDLIGRRLFAMNVAAMFQRYGESGVSPEEAADVAAYNYRSRDCSPAEMMKACECLLYQCSEGNVPETWPEYKQLTDRINELARAIVHNTPEYTKAPWDFDTEN